MNNKILVTVEVPLLGTCYDMFIPINKKVGTVKNYCIEMINDLSENAIKEPNKLHLFDKDGCNIYDVNIYVKNSGIKNGTRLLLI